MSSLLNDILRAVSGEFGSRPAAIMTTTRGKPEDARARAIAMYVYHRAEPAAMMTMSGVGQVFHRDRTTVRHALSRVEEWKRDRSFAQRLIRVQQEVSAVGYPGGVQ